MTSTSPFKWPHFQPEIILCGVRWYLRYSLSYRDVEELMLERGLTVDHTTVFRWVQRYAPELNPRSRPHLNPTNDSYRVDDRVHPDRVLGSFETADRTLQGYEVMHMIRKGQLTEAEKGDVLSQNAVIDQLFGLAA